MPNNIQPYGPSSVQRYVTNTDEEYIALRAMLAAYQAAGGLGVLDHGALNGRADDDHTQYLLRTDADYEELIGGGAIDLHSHAGGGGESSGIVPVHIQLTNAQILALPTTSIELVAAPGANLALVFHGAFAYLNQADSYGNVDADPGAVVSICLGVIAGSHLIVSMQANAREILFFPDPQSVTWFMPREPLNSYNPLTGISADTMVNTPLFLKANNVASGNYTGGHANTTWDFTIWVSTIDVTTGMPA